MRQIHHLLEHKRHRMPNNKLPKRRDVASALSYINKRFALGIEYLGFDHLSEDARACILYDLANLPLEMVIERLRSEGAYIE